MTTTIHRLLLAFAVLTSSSTTTLIHAAPGDLLWSDEFDTPGPPNALYWNYDLGGGGWGNWEYQDYTSHPDNVIVEADGALKIRAQRTSATTFTSARLKTAERLYFRYGTVEARVQIPDLRNGLWAAVWTLGQTFPRVLWPDCGELDILEMGWSQAIASGAANRLVLSAVHFSQNGNHRPNINWATPPYDLNTGYHVYKLEWTPDSIRMSVDDYETLYVTGIDLASCGGECGELHQPHYLIMNLAVGGGFTQQPTDPNDGTRITAAFPATMAIDYVRIIDNGFTELSGPAVDGSGGGAPVTVAPIATPAAPITAAPVTAAPIPAPLTEPPTTQAPVTVAPTTAVPTTPAPATLAPTTAVPTTPAPATLAPTTPVPTTASPTTVAPSTTQPSTGSPTVEPSTDFPRTAVPTVAPSNQLRSPTSSSSPTTLSPSSADGVRNRSTDTTLPPTTTPAEVDAGALNPIQDGDVSAAPSVAWLPFAAAAAAATVAAALPIL